VTFQVTLGGGNIGGQVLFTTNTDASGIARVPAWTLGTTAGVVNSLSAQVVSGPQLVINVTTQ
jgi:hypothetical protein